MNSRLWGEYKNVPLLREFLSKRLLRKTPPANTMTFKDLIDFIHYQTAYDRTALYLPRAPLAWSILGSRRPDRGHMLC